MNSSHGIEPDFAAEMHELSAQASQHDKTRSESGISILISAVHTLNQRVESLEESVMQRLEGLHFPKLEEQLSAIRDSETVNQKLFDSLHQELISYRDNFVRESLQKPFIRDLVVLFDDLRGIARQLAAEVQPNECSPNEQLRTNLENTIHFLVEILHRLEVNEIAPTQKFDRNLHRALEFEPAASLEEDGVIVRRIRPGFIWRDKVLRPEEVVAKRF